MTQVPASGVDSYRTTGDKIIESIGVYEYGWHDSDDCSKNIPTGINGGTIHFISEVKDEPQWVWERRLKALELFECKPMPVWGPDLSHVDFDSSKHHVRPTDCQVNDWENLPEEIRDIHGRLGIPEAEKSHLVSGVAAQCESEAVYQQIQGNLERRNVVFIDTDTGLREYPGIFEEYFGKCVSAGDNKFSVLNVTAWSGGSFVYIPKGVHVAILLQAYFRINTSTVGQFERMLIIADEGPYARYAEGCTAPICDGNSLHSGVIKIFVKKDTRVRCTTTQNQSTNVLNLVIQRVMVEEGGTMEWIDGNMGIAITMKYPAYFLMGEHARGGTLSIGFAGPGQQQDTSAKMMHMVPHTPSSIVSKSVS